MSFAALVASCGTPPAARPRAESDGRKGICPAGQVHFGERCMYVADGEAHSPGAPPLEPSPAASASTAADDVDAVVAKHRWRFKACYNKALAIDPTVTGMVAVTVTLAADGTVASATILRAEGDASLAECVREAFEQMGPFRAPAGGKAVFSLPVVFSQKERPPARAPKPRE